MADLLNVATDQVESVPDSEVAARVASGAYRLPAGRVEVRDREGNRGSIDASEAQSAFQRQGFSYVPTSEIAEETERRDAADSEVSATAAGVARGVTLGLSDYGLTKSGLVEPKRLRLLEEENPTLSAGAELVGNVLPVVATWGAAAPAAVATRAGAAVAGKVASNVVARGLISGAIEGGLYGAGSAISEDALGKAPLTAQKLVADVGLNALLGGAGGALFGKLEGVLGRRATGEVGEAIEERVAREAAEGVIPPGPTPEPVPVASTPGEPPAQSEASRVVQDARQRFPQAFEGPGPGENTVNRIVEQAARANRDRPYNEVTQGGDWVDFARVHGENVAKVREELYGPGGQNMGAARSGEDTNVLWNQEIEAAQSPAASVELTPEEAGVDATKVGLARIAPAEKDKNFFSFRDPATGTDFELQVENRGKELYIANVKPLGMSDNDAFQNQYEAIRNSLGPRVVLNMARDLARAFPEAERLTGNRATGWNPGREVGLKLPKVKAEAPVTYEFPGRDPNAGPQQRRLYSDGPDGRLYQNWPEGEATAPEFMPVGENPDELLDAASTPAVDGAGTQALDMGDVIRQGRVEIGGGGSAWDNYPGGRPDTNARGNVLRPEDEASVAGVVAQQGTPNASAAPAGASPGVSAGAPPVGAATPNASPASAAGAAAPNVPASAGGPTGGSGGGRWDPEDIIGRIAGSVARRGEQLSSVAEAAARKYRPTMERLFEAMGIPVPTNEEWVIRGLDLKSPEIARLVDKELFEAAPARLLADPRAKGIKNADDALKLMRTILEEQGPRIERNVKRLDELAKPEELLSVPRLAEDARQGFLGKMSLGTVDEKRAAARVAEELDGLLKRAEVAAATKDTPATYRNLSFQEVEEFKRALDKSLKWDAITPNEVRDQLRQLRGLINASQEERAALVAARQEGADANLAKDFIDAKRTYGEISELEKGAAKRAEVSRKSNRVFSLTDNLAAGAAISAGGFNPIGLAAGVGAAMINKWGRERLPWIFALQMHAAEGGAERTAAQGLRKAVQGADAKATKAGTEAFGKFSETLRRAAAMGERELWAMHTALSADPEYRQVMEAQGLSYDGPMDDAGKRRANLYNEVQKQQEKWDKQVEKDAKAVMSGGKVTRAPRLSPKQAMARAQDYVDMAAKGPDSFIENVTRKLGPMSSDAPATTAAVIATVTRAATFLYEKAPKPSNPNMQLPALRPPFRPSDAEASKFGRYVQAVESPRSVLAEAARGEATPEGMEALETVYPEMLADVREKVVIALADWDTLLPYARRLAVSQLLGRPLDESLRPASLASLQAAFQQEDSKPPQKRAAVGAGGDSAFAAELTQSQRVETRRLTS